MIPSIDPMRNVPSNTITPHCLPYYTFSVSNEPNLSRSHLSGLEQSILAIVFESCRSSEWKQLLQALRERKNVRQLILIDCNFTCIALSHVRHLTRLTLCSYSY